MARLKFNIGADTAIIVQLCDGETLDAEGNVTADTDYILTGTVTAQLFTDEDVAAFTPAVSLTFVTSSDGEFRGVVDDAAINGTTFPPGNGYYLKIIASTPSGANRTWKLPARVQ